MVIGLIDIIYGAYKQIIEGEKKVAKDQDKSEIVGEAVKRVQISL